jgi:hypothetical protein
VIPGVLAAAGAAQAQVKSCEQLRDEIAQRMGRPKDSFRLEISPADEVVTGKTMGRCESGTRKVVGYFGAAATAAGSASAAAPAEAATASAAPVARLKPETPPPPADAAVQSQASAIPPPVRSRRANAVDQQTLDQYQAWIHEAREKHPYADTAQRMYDVMVCESKGNAVIVNPAGPYYGLFQYAKGTWKSPWNTYAEADVRDAKAQIFATALAWQLRKQGMWGCYKRAH